MTQGWNSTHPSIKLPALHFNGVCKTGKTPWAGLQSITGQTQSWELETKPEKTTQTKMEHANLALAWQYKKDKESGSYSSLTIIYSPPSSCCCPPRWQLLFWSPGWSKHFVTNQCRCLMSQGHSSSLPPLPAGPAVIWYADEDVESPGRSALSPQQTTHFFGTVQRFGERHLDP